MIKRFLLNSNLGIKSFEPRKSNESFEKQAPVQCSPYQAVTGEIYRLKQHFLPPASSWSLTKIK